MYGAIVRSGHKQWTGLRAKILFPPILIGTYGSDPHKSVLTRRRGRKEMEMVMDANAVARAGSIIRLYGVVGRISGRVRWAIWLATPPTCRSARSSWVTRPKSQRKARASIKNPIR